MSRHANVEKNRFGTWFLFVVFGFCWMILYLWIRVPKVLSGEKTLGTLWGLSQYPSGPQGLVQRGDTWSQFPLLRWDDDDRWETVANLSKTSSLQKRTISNKLHENVWTQVHKSLKNHMWHGCLGWWSLWLHLWGHPWPMKGPSFLCTSLQLSCCLDLSWYLSGPYLDEFGS